MKGNLRVGGDVFTLLLRERQIQRRVNQLGARINRDYSGKVPVVLGVLNGSLVFLADLIRRTTLECEVDWIQIASYGGARKGGTAVRLLREPERSLCGRDVILVEDIVDTGRSLTYLRRYVAGKNPRSCKVVTLLYKRHSAPSGLSVDYIGFRIPAVFVIGYGLDYAQRFRNLRGIYRLARSGDAPVKV